MALTALTSRRKGWRLTKPLGRPTSGRDRPQVAEGPGSPWSTFNRALRDGWQATRPTYNPDTRLWSAWAVPSGSVPVLPVHGFGPTAAAAVLDVAARLSELFGADAQPTRET
jgi:hypothetical protein